MQRRNFIKASAAALSAAPLARPGRAFGATPGAKRPNVVVFLTDQWRAQSIGYAGDANARTPTLDALAAQSVNCTNMTSNVPLCCPARGCLITGQYPLKHGVIINDVQLKSDTVTMGEAFRNAGYRTGYIGKWHLHGSPDGLYGRRDKFVPPDQRFGFDYWKASECDHDYNHEHYFAGDDQTRRYWPGYAPFAQTDDAIAFVDAHKADEQPFFLMLSVGPPHFPWFSAPERYRAMFGDADMALRPNIPSYHDARATDTLRGYYAHAAALDDCVKRMLATLDESGLADDTIFVFGSDHGEMMFSHGLEGKLYPFEESVRVPLLIRYPRKFGRTGRTFASHIGLPDIMPTLLGLSGVAVPPGIQGIDFSAALQSKQGRGTPKSAFLIQPVATLQMRQHGMDAYRGVRTERYSYIRAVNGPWLLYDLKDDPYQMTNLVGTARGDAALPALEAELKMWLRRTGDAFLPGDAYLEQADLSHYRETKTAIGAYRSPWGDWGPTLRAA